jgi:hypothetical protein
MEPDLYTVDARDRERLAHNPRLPIFGHELKTRRSEKRGMHAHMLDSGVRMTRLPLERPATQRVRYHQHD